MVQVHVLAGVSPPLFVVPRFTPSLVSETIEDDNITLAHSQPADHTYEPQGQ